ncbi:MAG TPA: hypothetical protein VHB21_03890 [Minicystis sp.]|nr:hypothetical protein [Minicystis sp.]
MRASTGKPQAPPFVTVLRMQPLLPEARSYVFDFRGEMLHGAAVMASEAERTRLIGDIARMLRDESPVPDDARAAALTLIGWLARRMPGESAHRAGLDEMMTKRAAVLVEASERVLARAPAGREAAAARTLRRRVR